MARHTENLRDITTFLMMNNSNPMKGYTAAEIAASVPTLKESSVYRVLRSNPQFVQTDNSIHPKRYWFDPLKVKIVRDQQYGKLHIRPELAVTDRELVDWFGSLVANLKPADEDPYASRVYASIKVIGTALNNADFFQRNVEPLQPALWDKAKQHIDSLEVFAATLYQRIYELKNDPRYDSPEWWSMVKESK